MFNLFDSVDSFFAAFQSNNINHNISFILFLSLFIFTVIVVLIIVSHSYEAKLTKSVDMFNNYLMENPNINEENLVTFNNKMKSKKVPKQLRKQWQQYVLYREGKASSYMSFENCVSNPSKNSTYKRSVNIMNILAYTFALCELIVNLYVSYVDMPILMVLQKCFLGPAIILLINYFVTIFLNLRYNAIVSDLHQNYQYFEVNMDKATKTLPDYVDYEVLFDKNEIKRGIPILYAYLQKRAEEEQRELELARLKNVEHEKFNFDEAGVAGSLVLERAMQEAENYIAERKKYNQDTEQINSDITQEDMNFREITKEYNRQMQVSKETFANFKAQLEEASSSIEANYIKKQQQQELDRQRNLERDYDTASERHKKIIESYHAELDGVDKFRAQSRKVLEDAMMSEFETYSSKVYDEAKRVVDQREKEKYNKVKKQIRDLEEQLVIKNKELENVYNQNQLLNEKLEGLNMDIPLVAPTVEAPVEQVEENFEENYENEFLNDFEENVETAEVEEVEENLDNPFEQDETLQDYEEENLEEVSNENVSTSENESAELGVTKRKAGRPRKITEDVPAEPKRGRGRPKKVVEKTEPVEKKKPGRPKKVEEKVATEPKKGRGRPRKEPAKQVETEQNQKKGRGRPKKVQEEQASQPKKGRGRPRKEPIEQVETEQKPKKGRGRPKKMKIDDITNIEDIDAYLKEIDDVIAQENAKFEASKKELEKKAKNIKKKK